MEKIDFFTPISYPEKSDSCLLRLTSFIDSYFYLGGKKATIVQATLNGRAIGVQLAEDDSSFLWTALKVVSYITLLLPAIMLAAKACLRAQYDFFIVPDQRIPMSIEKPAEKQDTTVWKTVHAYPGDLSSDERTKLKLDSSRGDLLEVEFSEFPDIDFSVRMQNIFQSKAEVIINAANTHLGGGGGIDGAIHREGGFEYAEAHGKLRDEYHANYTEGYAAMIESGLLKKKYKIDNVIVIAGPQGASTPQKERELYSCYYNSLVLADHHKKTRIAFPSISTGLFYFPKDRAAAISLRAISNFLKNYPNTTVKTISIHFLPNEPVENLKIYERAATV